MKMLQRLSQNPPTPITILVVDDEEPIRQIVGRVLRGAGYNTAIASNGAEAVQLAATLDSIDVLVTDMMMPEMTGDELARRLRHSHPELKILYYTGFSDRLFEGKRTMWEDEAFLEKPCSSKGLLEAVSLLHNQRISGAHLNQACAT